MRSNGFQLRGVSFVMLDVQNLASSLSFYRDQLDLLVMSETPGFAFLGAGTITIGLSEPLGKSGVPVADAAEIVFSVEHVRPAYDSLVRDGVKFIREPRNMAGDSWAATHTDPDGHKLSIYGPE